MKLRLFTSGKIYKCAKCNKAIYPRDKYTKYDHANLCYECYCCINQAEEVRENGS